MDLNEIWHKASKWDDGPSDSFGATPDPLVSQGGQINLAILGIFADFSRYFLNRIVDLDEILHEASKWDDGSSDNYRPFPTPWWVGGGGVKLIWKFLPCMTEGHHLYGA